MLKFVGIVALLMSVLLAGITTCPRGALSCTMAMQRPHDCCAKGSGIRRVDCCGHEAQQPARSVAAGIISQYQTSVTSFVGMTPALPLRAAVSEAAVLQWLRFNLGPAPPYTPLSNHTLLLL